MQKKSLLRSTGIVAASTLVSRISGFIRDMLIANYFGASGSLDGFFVAFRIPNLFRRLVGEGALTISFIPVYTEYLINNTREEALDLARKTLSILIIVLAVIVLLGVLFSEQIVQLFAVGFQDPSQLMLTIDLTRIMFPYLFLVGLVAFAMGYLNSHGYFFTPAFSPVLLNIGFILGAVLFRKYFNEPLYGLALGVMAGGILQVILQVPSMIRAGFRMKFSIDLKHPGIRKIFRLIAPATFGIAVYQINILMNTVLASLLPSGSISYLFYSDRLTEIVLGVFIVSIGNVILPEMSRVSAMDDIDRLKKIFRTSVNAALFLAIPASAALMIIGYPILSVLFMRGEFTSFHTEMTQRALFFSSAGICSIALLRITTPTYYSLKDTRTPVITSTIAFVVNITFGYILMKTFLLHAGLALANTLAVTVQVSILVIVLRKKIGSLHIREYIVPVSKIIAASLGMGIVLHYISGYADWTGGSFSSRLITLIVMVTTGGAVYFAICMALKVEELTYVIEKLKRKVGR
ncbi:MAG TPA: murein biosynthesis integral membrane protein MurJ [Spirochaetota bacterium]|nr:murein biosynthesis integral membrane protein MurJ [Spirochaetota bacterium]